MLYSGDVTFTCAISNVAQFSIYKRIEISITVDNVVTTHFINNATTDVNYAIPLIYTPLGTNYRRIAFTDMSFSSDGHIYLSKFPFSDNFGNITTMDKIKAAIVIVGYKK